MPGMNRSTTGVVLPTEVSSEIWEKTVEESAVMQLSRRIELPGAGMEFPMITGEPEANWVNETDKKPVSNHKTGSKKMKGYTMAVIVPFSNQFKRDAARLYDEMVASAPKSLGTKLDKTVFGGDTKPGELFDTMADVASVDIESDTWKGLVTADAMVSAGDGILNGWAIAPQAKTMLLTATDAQKRPLFINSMTSDNSVPALMGQPTHVKKGVYLDGSPKQLGFAGDWSSALYGVVEDIKTSISEQATITIDGEPVNLWEQNMFAVRFEFEVGFRMKYPEHFVKLVGKIA